MSEQPKNVDAAMDDLLKAAKTRRPEDIKGPARVLKADDLRAFIKGMVESMAGKSQAELITRISELEMQLGAAKPELEALRGQVKELTQAKEFAERRAAASQVDALAAREEAGRAKGENDAVKQERDEARTRADSLEQQIAVMDAEGDKVKLAAEIVKLKEMVAGLERALEFADLASDVPYGATLDAVKAALGALGRDVDSVMVDRSAVEAVGAALVSGLAETDAAVRELRREIEEARGSIGVVARLASCTARGQALHECAGLWQRALQTPSS